MRSFDDLGRFWIPGYDSDTLDGRLEFNPSSKKGITVSLVGQFKNSLSGGDLPDGRLHGWVGSDPITLDRAWCSGEYLRAPGLTESRYYANCAFVGAHIEAVEPTFTTASVSISGLDEWVEKSGVSQAFSGRGGATTSPGDQGSPIYRLDFQPLPDEAAEFSGGLMKLVFTWKRSGDPVRGINFHQQPVLRIEYRHPSGFEEVRKDVGRLVSLVTLCMDSFVDVERMNLSSPEFRISMLDGSVTDQSREIEYVAPPLRVERSNGRPRERSGGMFLTYSQLGGIEVVAQWLDASRRFQRPLDSLMSVERAEHMFAENRFMNVTFAAEAFHRTVIGGNQMDVAEFEDLFSKYLDSTPEEHHSWLRSKLGFGNEPTLRKRLTDLAGRSSPSIKALIPDKKRWAHVLASVRNEATHIGDKSSAFEGADLAYMTMSVYAVLRMCMLIEAGVSAEVHSDRRDAGGNWAWYSTRLQTSIERVRAALRAEHQ